MTAKERNQERTGVAARVGKRAREVKVGRAGQNREQEGDLEKKFSGKKRENLGKGSYEKN